MNAAAPLTPRRPIVGPQPRSLARHSATANVDRARRRSSVDSVRHSRLGEPGHAPHHGVRPTPRTVRVGPTPRRRAIVAAVARPTQEAIAIRYDQRARDVDFRPALANMILSVRLRTADQLTTYAQSKPQGFAVGLPGSHPAPGLLIAELPWFFTVPRLSLFLGIASLFALRKRRRCLPNWLRWSFLVGRLG